MAIFQAPLAASPTSLPGCCEGAGERLGRGAGRPPAGARRAGPQALVKLAGEEPGEVSN